jgi:hypothetical protein
MRAKTNSKSSESANARGGNLRRARSGEKLAATKATSHWGNSSLNYNL